MLLLSLTLCIAALCHPIAMEGGGLRYIRMLHFTVDEGQ